MALKYVDIFATNNGDGTTKDQAASAGATGAWNVIPFIGAPAYGSISAGDTIYIRSKSGSTNATYTGGSSNLTFYASFSTNPLLPITWVADNGTIWTGDNGTLTVTASTSTGSIIFKACAIFQGYGIDGAQNFIFQESYNGNASIAAIPENLEFRNCLFTTTYAGSNGYMFTNVAPASNVGDHWSRWKSCHFIAKKCASGQGIMMPGVARSQWEFWDCTFDMSNIANLVTGYLFVPGSYGNWTILLRGGKITGGNEQWVVFKETTPTQKESVSFLEATKFDPGLLKMITPYASTQINTLYLIYEDIVGGDKDSIYTSPQCYTQWKGGQNYPYLYGLARDYTPWSYMVFPTIKVGAYNHAELARLQKINTLADASRTITCNFLLQTNSDAYLSPQKNQWWVEGWYTNSSDVVVYFSTYTTGNLATSTAAWNPLTSAGLSYYGPNTYQPYMIQYTTSDQLKQNTIVYATLKSAKPSITSDDYYFVDPSIVIE